MNQSGETGIKYLIIHGDDVGVSHGVNRASLRLLQAGHISSVSMMAPCPWVFEAATVLKDCKHCDIGVHITLNSEFSSYRWPPTAPYSSVPGLVDELGTLHRSLSDTMKYAGLSDVRKETEAQIAKIRKLGLAISHIDIHMGTVAMKAEWLKIYVDIAERNKVLPMLVRWSDELEAYFKLRNMPYDEVKDFLKEKERSGYFMLDRLITDVGGLDSYEDRRDAYVRAIRSLKPGLTQIITHLSDPGEELSAMIGNKMREVRRTWDTKILSDPGFIALLREEKISLTSWSQLNL
ncbi:MAG: polysaccharide deacetylase family protein [Deltaproteobacteria bacterium]|nr:polysaccharide deacetylase family protein [Deltaproteobacteria bacterium]